MIVLSARRAFTLLLCSLLSACANDPPSAAAPPEAPTAVPPALLETPSPAVAEPQAAPAAAPADPAARTKRLQEDRLQPINARADRISFDQKKSVTVYQGSVVFTQGGLRIEADRVEARLRNERLEAIFAHGKPLRFRQAGVPPDPDLHGSAARLEYNAEKARMSLFGEVRLTQGPNHFRSAVMHYDLEQQTLSADGGEDGQVSMEIAAETLKPDADDATRKRPTPSKHP